MERTWTIAISAMFLLLILALPQASQAATWNFSKHRILMASDPAPGQPADETAAPASPTLKKNIGKGAMFSLIIPGAGELYSGSWARAIPWFVIEVGGWYYFAKFHGEGKNKTDDFQAYAGPRTLGFDQPQSGHFNVNAYMYREYQIASNPQLNSTPYSDAGGLNAWENETWATRVGYFESVAGFTHDVMTDDMQQYYEMIGKYINQFGYGWDDTWDPSMVPNSNGIYHFEQLGTGDAIWNISGDDAATAEFDGHSPMFFHYRDMRGRANDLLNKGNVAMEVVLVNHVVSALDAAFSVRRYNKHLEPGKLGDLKLHYDAREVNGAVARFVSLSLPF